ncbi:MAG: serine/threonine-protein kinase [Planctomycetota bacterium]
MQCINEYDLQFGLLALRMYYVGGEQLITAINEWEDGSEELSAVLMRQGVMSHDETSMIASMLPSREQVESASEQTPNQPPTTPVVVADTASSNGANSPQQTDDEATVKEDTVREGTVREDTIQEGTVREDTVREDTVREDTVKEKTVRAEKDEDTVVMGTDSVGTQPIGQETTTKDEKTVRSSSDDTVADSDDSRGPKHYDFGNRDRFVRLKSYAKGALGEVFLARDRDLRRDVAVKEILSDCAKNQSNQARFVYEAEVTGSLEHPGIVPIYALGNSEDGRPFYAMRFIEGASMDDVIRDFHTDGGHANPIAALTLRELLGQMVDVCNTMAYSHSRGVIHRDLKPANVMIGRYGETLVVDWGLAKRLDDSAELDRSGLPEDTARNDFEATQMGQAFGTPQYMSPEQATGQLDRVDSRSDIYALGAMLYKVLAGKPAFTGQTLQDILQSVRTGSFLRPRQVDSSIPKPLEAICLKAMSLDPNARYQSADEIARDLSSWMADEPVTAFRAPLSARVGRWMRRHRSIVGSAFIATVSIITVLIVSVLMLTSAYQTAERNRKLAREAVDKFFTVVSEDVLLKQPGMEQLRGELLDEALTYYQGFLEDDPGGNLKREIGLTKYFVGKITEEAESPAEALAFYQQAEKELRALTEKSSDPQLRAELGNTLNAIGRANDKQEKTDQAIDSYREALKIRAQLAADYPDNAEYQRTHANTLMNLGLSLQQTGASDEAMKLVNQAQTIRKEKRSDSDVNEQIKRDLAKGSYNLAFIFLQEGNFEEAEKELNLASSTFEELVAQTKDLDDSYRLGVVNQSLGELKAETEGFAKAAESFQKSASTFQDLLYRIPGVTEYQFRLANLLLTMGQQQETEQAFQSLSEASRILNELIQFSEGDPKQLEYLFALASVYVSVAERQPPEVSLGTLQQAESILTDLKQRAPNNQAVRETLEFVSGQIDFMRNGNQPSPDNGVVPPSTPDDGATGAPDAEATNDSGSNDGAPSPDINNASDQTPIESSRENAPES